MQQGGHTQLTRPPRAQIADSALPPHAKAESSLPLPPLWRGVPPHAGSGTLAIKRAEPSGRHPEDCSAFGSINPKVPVRVNQKLTKKMQVRSAHVRGGPLLGGPASQRTRPAGLGWSLGGHPAILLTSTIEFRQPVLECLMASEQPMPTTGYTHVAEHPQSEC